jgi:hypothetical protein
MHVYIPAWMEIYTAPGQSEACLAYCHLLQPLIMEFTCHTDLTLVQLTFRGAFAVGYVFLLLWTCPVVPQHPTYIHTPSRARRDAGLAHANSMYACVRARVRM